MLDYALLVKSIIEAQESIIGPVAIERASSVHGLTVDWKQKAVTVGNDPGTVLEGLVGKYKELFGDISIEVCRDVAHKVVGSGDRTKLPQYLQ